MEESIMEIKVYIPNKDQNGDVINSSLLKAAIYKIRLMFTEKFGGCTVTKCTGMWKEHKELYLEDVSVISCSHDFSPDDLLAIYGFLYKIKQELLYKTILTTTQEVTQVWI